MTSRSFPSVNALPAVELRRRLAPIVLDKRNPRARFSNWAKTFDCVPGLGESGREQGSRWVWAEFYP